MEFGKLPVPARPERAGRLAGCGEGCLGVVPRIAARAGDGHLQLRNIARLGAGADYRRADHQALRLAQRLRLYGIGWTGVAVGLVDFVSAAALESLAALGRIREAETAIAIT